MATNPYALLGYAPPTDINVLAGLQPQQQDPSQAMPPVSSYGGADPSANIGQLVQPAQQANFMQQAADGAGSMAPLAQQPATSAMPQQFPNAPAPGGNAPRQRLSLVDTIGRISDVLAKVGGAPEQYQPYLDQRIAQQQGQQGNALDMQAKQADIKQTGVATQTAQNSMLGNFARAVQGAIKGGADPHQAIAGFAEQLGIPPNIAAIFGHQYDQNPSMVDALASVADPNSREVYSTQPIWTTDADGKPVLAQISSKGNFKVVDTGGLTPSDEVKTQNLGNRFVYTTKHSTAPVRSQIINGKLGTDETARVDASGNVVAATPLPGSVAAGNLANANTRTANDTTRTTIAANKAGAGKGTEGTAVVNRLLDNISNGFNDLDKLQALPGQGGAASVLGRTGVGQLVGEQLAHPAAQKRLEVMKNVNQLQQQMIKSLPASASRTKFEQEILARSLPDPFKMSHSTANNVIKQLRDDYATAMAGAQAETAGRPSPLPTGRKTLGAPAAATRGASKPQVLNW